MDKKIIHGLRQSIFSKFTKIDEKMNEFDRKIDNNVVKSVLEEDIKYFKNKKTISILYFDDETRNLKKIEEILKNDYNIFLAHNIDVALDILKKESIDIVMLEQKMNTENSINFLSSIKKSDNLNTNPLFMILSPKIENIVKTINETNTLKYIVSSMDLNMLRQKIQEIYNYRLNKA